MEKDLTEENISSALWFLKLHVIIILTSLCHPHLQILSEAEQIPLEDSSRGLTYELLCTLAHPSRRDTRGMSQLAGVAERFAFSLVTSVACGSEGQRSVICKILFWEKKKS